MKTKTNQTKTDDEEKKKVHVEMTKVGVKICVLTFIQVCTLQTTIDNMMQSPRRLVFSDNLII